MSPTTASSKSGGFTDAELWPVSFAPQTWSPAVEQKVAALVKTAVS